MPSPSHHIDTAIVATSRKPTLLVTYLESYLNDLQRWLSEWIIAINVSKSTAIIFARARRRFIQPRAVTRFGEPMQWVDKTRYLGVTLDTRLTLPPHIHQVRKKTAQRISPSGTQSCYRSSSSAPWWTTRVSHGGPLPAPTSRGCRCCNPSVFASLRVTFGTLVTGKSKRTRMFHFCRPHHSPDCELWHKPDVGNPVVRQVGRWLRWPIVDPVAWRESQGRQGPAGQLRLSPDDGQVD